VKIIGIEGMTGRDLAEQLARGARFVTFHYVISVVVLTFRRPSNIYLIRPGERAFVRGLRYSLLTLLVGWWALPFGVLFSLMALVNNCRGGQNVTDEVVRLLNRLASGETK